MGSQGHMVLGLFAPNAICAGNPSNAQTAIYGALVCVHVNNEGGWNSHCDDNLSATTTTTGNPTGDGTTEPTEPTSDGTVTTWRILRYDEP